METLTLSVPQEDFDKDSHRKRDPIPAMAKPLGERSMRLLPYGADMMVKGDRPAVDRGLGSPPSNETFDPTEDASPPMSPRSSRSDIFSLN